MGFTNWLDRQQKKEADAVRDRRGYKSSFYHKEFEGYSERLSADESGRLQIERTYIADYFAPRLTRKQEILHRSLYGLSFIAAVVLYVFAGLQDTASNYAVYVVIPVAVSLPALFFTVLALFNYLPLGKLELPRMKKGPKRLRRAALVSGAALIAASVATLVYLLIHCPAADGRGILCAISYFAAGALMFAVFLVERRIIYDVVRNESNPDGAIVIT